MCFFLSPCPYRGTGQMSGLSSGVPGIVPGRLLQREAKPEKSETKWANLSHHVQSSTSQPYHSNIKYFFMYSYGDERMSERQREHECPVKSSKAASLG